LDESDRRREDEWFRKNEKELLKAARTAREKREAERAAREKDEERQRLRAAHFMKCPKCGHDLREETIAGVKVDRCSFCEGIYLDAGELDELFLKKEGERRGLLGKLIGVQTRRT
jgi:ribosomal protein L32